MEILLIHACECYTICVRDSMNTKHNTTRQRRCDGGVFDLLNDEKRRVIQWMVDAAYNDDDEKLLASLRAFDLS